MRSSTSRAFAQGVRSAFTWGLRSASAWSALALTLTACGGGSHQTVIGRNDGGVVEPDLAVTPPVPDFATPPDLASPWRDESYHSIADMGSLLSVWNDEQGSVVAVGDRGTVVRSQSGGPFTLDPSTIPNPLDPATLHGVFGASPSDVFTVGTAGALWKWTGSDLMSTATWAGDYPPAQVDYYFGVWVAPDGEAFVDGSTTVLRRSGDFMGTMPNWTVLPGAPATHESTDGIFGFMTAPGVYSVYVAGCLYDPSTFYCTAPRIWHTTGTTLTRETVPAPCSLVYSVWGSSPTDLYASCDTGILHSTGDGTWVAQKTSVTTARLWAIGGSGPDNVYAAGDSDPNGLVILSKHDATSDVWQKERLPLLGAITFYGISVTPSDVYAVGALGTILHK